MGGPAPGPEALAALASEVRRQLGLLDYPRHPWVPSRGEGVLDVAIIGAGQTGLATAHGLLRERVQRVRVFDAAPKGGTGVWTTFARMRTLRTPKHVTGPDLGIPALTPRAFFTARDGEAAWENLHKIGRVDWQRYLDWLEETLNLPVAHGHRLLRIGRTEARAPLELTFSTPGGETVIRARKLVLATGMDGMGGWSIPAPFDTLPPARVSHTSGHVNFEALMGKRILVVGAGASAFDNLATALEAGAAHATMLVRRRQMPRVNPFRWMEQSGFLGQLYSLPDALRWRFMQHIFALNQPPPQESWNRVAEDPRFELHMGSPVTAVREEGAEVVVTTPRAEHRTDHVIVGTGTAFDLSLRPELAPFAAHVLLWRDAYTPPKGLEFPALGACPYLRDDFSLREKTPGAAPFLHHIHIINYGSTASMGLSGASISGMKYGATRLVDGICRRLWQEDAEFHLQDLLTYDEPELTSDIPQELPGAATALVAE
ncbi:NAD(P)/FAD-dependent oxidoreductase [Roseomonas sp. SG15]|uniref:NAD(P)/FAD-dependent oxidoreductase n=2 Tax=Roseomonas indoligenes TaxID=2820811 RepID=A0A940S3R0_9PROT|nr:NAD(P)/FAD-dependent oxidoreductase [Pararoseomonas indoligenes]MBP0492506.1 NAD(P)/FAD-dependent oxidoreductase [Pararoseomonas indoligenes]